MALPTNTGGNTSQNNKRGFVSTLRVPPPSFVKTFASPGIDSAPEEFGVLASAAGTPNHKAKGFKIQPWDWSNDAPEQGLNPGRLIGNFAATTAPIANKMAIRRRGVDPWGGSYKAHPHSMQHTGGITDLNPGADYVIAGGAGQASSFCRVNGVDSARGMKLPVFPQLTERAGVAAIPAGGTFDGSPAPPLMPRVSGWATIFAWRPRVVAPAPAR